MMSLYKKFKTLSIPKENCTILQKSLAAADGFDGRS